MIIVNYLISFLTGYLIYRLVDNKFLPSYTFLRLCTALSLGLGINALLTFTGFLILKSYHPWIILIINLAFLLGLSIWNVTKDSRFQNDFLHPLNALRACRLYDVLIWIIWIFLFMIIHLIATKHAFGEWDAWAMWNLKTKFLMYSPTPLTDILHTLSWHTHPDYPLLLPSMNVWTLNLFSGSFFIGPMFNSIILTFLCGMTLFAGLNIFVPKYLAYTGSLLLLTQPYFVMMGTSQYADVLLSLYLLNAIIYFCIATLHRSFPSALLAGLFLGLMAFTKNEGLVMGLILFAVFIFSQFLKKSTESMKLYTRALAGFFLTGTIALIFKIFLAPANDDILPFFTLENIQQLHPKRLVIIFQHIIREILHEKWCHIWVFLGILSLIRLPALFKKECRVLSCFFIVYFCVLVIIYFVNAGVSLTWWLKYSLARIFFTLLPSIIFINLFSFTQSSSDRSHD